LVNDKSHLHMTHYGSLSDLHTTVERYYNEELYFNRIDVWCTWGHNVKLRIFSSPEPKAQVSYCHRNLSGVRLLTFSFKRLLLTNHVANFNQTWWETWLGDGDSDLFK